MVTTGLGGIYPQGVLIGRVVGVAREQEGWERIYMVRPAVNLGTLGHVLLLGREAVGEAAMRAAEKKIGIALLPKQLSMRKFAQGRLVRLFNHELVTSEDYTLLVRPEDEARDDIRALCAWLTESCGKVEEN